jgi:pyruvate dehydrogenase E2 component (dihydrolipoamide acetyltransferase)
VDLDAVRGTGPGGMITREDVLKASQAAPAAAAPASPRTRNQDIVARKVSQSHREKPVFHVTARVNMTAAIAYHQKQAASYDAIFVKAAGAALAEFPAFVGQRDAIDVAIAIDVDDDLYAPAVRSPASRSAAGITREIEALVSKARAHALGPADAEGSCFLVSNLGMFPVESFDAVIYPEHSAALAVGAIVHTPVSDGRSTVIAPLSSLTLSVDHRFINGRAAARFIARVKQIVETGALE